ncbi:MAG: dTMP kinase [Clostridia bacterium]|nr:dTMP kinase [Clostridia bacterium]
MQNKKSPRFIVFEGIDGAGKTTQIDLLEKALLKQGVPVERTAEPTTGDTGKLLRRALSGEIPKTPEELALLFTLDRVEHNQAIEKALAAGKTVLCDRYYYSTIAYQGSASDMGWVKSLNLNCPAIRTPDLCLFLDLTPEESIQRIRARGQTAEIYETKEQLSKIRNRFLNAIKTLPNVRIVDAASSPERVHERILEVLRG